MDKLKKAAGIIKDSRKIVVVTGAGISASAGIPTFRDRGGLWREEDIVKFGSPETWVTDPWTCWHAYESFRVSIDSAAPTHAHRFVRALEERLGARVATTNVDSLHARSGTSALEIHGTLRTLRCLACGAKTDTGRGKLVEHPACKDCGNWRRHDVVLWGEEVRHLDELEELTNEADTLLLIGMSGVVTSTKELSKAVNRGGGSVIEINPSIFTPATWFTDVSLRMKADEACKRLENLVFS